MIKVLLADDHWLVREALRNSLAREPDIEIVGEAGDASTTFERTHSLRPDVVVLDVSLPDGNGIDVARSLKERTGVDAKIVALSIHADRFVVTEMLRAGAGAYVTKSSSRDELVTAIRVVAAGQTFLCPEVAHLLAEVTRSGAKVRETLSRREHEVLCLVAEGARSPEISKRLHIAVGTVEVHRRHIMRKLDLRTVAGMTKYAIREGLIAP